MRPFRAGFNVEFCFAFSGVKLKNEWKICKRNFYVFYHELYLL